MKPKPFSSFLTANAAFSSGLNDRREPHARHEKDSGANGGCGARAVGAGGTHHRRTTPMAFMPVPACTGTPLP